MTKQTAPIEVAEAMVKEGYMSLDAKIKGRRTFRGDQGGKEKNGVNHVQTNERTECIEARRDSNSIATPYAKILDEPYCHRVIVRSSGHHKARTIEECLITTT
jgi:hypothetical protein